MLGLQESVMYEDSTMGASSPSVYFSVTILSSTECGEPYVENISYAI